MRATMAEASRFPSGPITAFGRGGLSGLWESIVVAMVSSSGSFERLDRAGEGPRGSKPRARGFFFFGFSGEGVFASSSTFGAFLKSRAKRPGFGLGSRPQRRRRRASRACSGSAAWLGGGVPGPGLPRRVLGVGSVDGTSTRLLAARLAPHTGRCGLAQANDQRYLLVSSRR